MYERREIINFDLNMTMEEYLQEIGAYGYVDDQYFQIAITHARVKHITELRNILLDILRILSTNQYNKTVEVNKINDLSSQHTEEINDLLDVFGINNKSMYIDEHESYKAHTYLEKVLCDVDSTNRHVVNGFIAKLSIEECILLEIVKPYEDRFSNYEDVYDRIY
jgi:hypothetical protein